MYYDTKSKILELFDVDKIMLFEEDNLPILTFHQQNVLNAIIEKHKIEKFLQVKHLGKITFDAYTMLNTLLNKGLVLKIPLSQLYLRFGYWNGNKPKIPEKLAYATESYLLTYSKGKGRKWEQKFEETAGSNNPAMFVANIALKGDLGYYPAYWELFNFKIPEGKRLIKSSYPKLSAQRMSLPGIIS